MLKWPLIGCGCVGGGLMVLFVGTFAVLVGLEVAGVSVLPTPVPKGASTVAATTQPKPSSAPVQAPPPAVASTALPKPGQTSTLTTPAGLKLLITVMATEDNVQPDRSGPPAKGRYVAIDWSLKNDGRVDITVNRLDLKLQTSEGHIIQRGASIRTPDLNTDKLGPGQEMRGWLTYDIPSEARVKSALYQPMGERQFVIADFGQ